MPQDIRMEGIGVLRFPDDMDEHDIRVAIGKNYPDYLKTDEAANAFAQSESIISDRQAAKKQKEEYGILSTPAALVETAVDSAVAGVKKTAAFQDVTTKAMTPDLVGNTLRNVAQTRGGAPLKYERQTIDLSLVDQGDRVDPLIRDHKEFPVSVKSEKDVKMEAATKEFMKVAEEENKKVAEARAPLAPQESTVGMVAADIAGGIGSTAPIIAAAFLPFVGPAASFSIGGMMAASDTFEQAINKGDDYDAALSKAAAVGITTAPMEAIGGRVVTAGGKAFWKVTNKAAPKIAEAAAEKAVGAATTRLGAAATRAGESFLAEGFEEASQSAIQQAFVDGQVDIKSMLYEGMIGGFSGAAMGAPFGYFSPVAKRPKTVEEARQVMPDIVDILERNDRTEVLGAYLRDEIGLKDVLAAAGVDSRTRTKYGLLDLHYPALDDVKVVKDRLAVIDSNIRDMVTEFYADIPEHVAQKMDPNVPVETPIATEAAVHQDIPDYGIPVEQTRDYLVLKNEQDMLRKQLAITKIITDKGGTPQMRKARLDAMRQVDPKLYDAIKDDPVMEKYSKGIYTAEEIFQGIHDVFQTRSSSIFDHGTSLSILSYAYQNRDKIALSPAESEGRIKPGYRLPDDFTNAIHRTAQGSPREKSAAIEWVNSALAWAAADQGYETIDDLVKDKQLDVLEFANQAMATKELGKRALLREDVFSDTSPYYVSEMGLPYNVNFNPNPYEFSYELAAGTYDMKYEEDIEPGELDNITRPVIIVGRGLTSDIIAYPQGTSIQDFGKRVPSTVLFPQVNTVSKAFAAIENESDFNIPPTQAFARLSKLMTKADMFWSHITIENLRRMAKNNGGKVNKAMIRELIMSNSQELTVYRPQRGWARYTYPAPNLRFVTGTLYNIMNRKAPPSVYTEVRDALENVNSTAVHDIDAAYKMLDDLTQKYDFFPRYVHDPSTPRGYTITPPVKEDLIIPPHYTDPQDAGHDSHGGGTSSIGHILFQEGFKLTENGKKTRGLMVLEVQSNANPRLRTEVVVDFPPSGDNPSTKLEPGYPYQEGRIDALLIHALQTANNQVSSEGKTYMFLPASFGLISDIEKWGIDQQTFNFYKTAKAELKAQLIKKYAGLNPEEASKKIREGLKEFQEEQGFISYETIADLYLNTIPGRLKSMFGKYGLTVEKVDGINGNVDHSLYKVSWGQEMADHLDYGPTLGYKEGGSTYNGAFLARDPRKNLTPVIALIHKRATPRTIIHEVMHFLMHEMRPEALRELGKVVKANDPRRADVDFGNINNWKQGVKNGVHFNDHEIAANAWAAFMVADSVSNKELAPIYTQAADIVRDMFREYPRELALRIPVETREFLATMFGMHDVNRDLDMGRAWARLDNIKTVAMMAQDEGLSVNVSRGKKKKVTVQIAEPKKPFFMESEGEMKDVISNNDQLAPAWNPRWSDEVEDDMPILDWMHMYGQLEGGQRAEIGRRATELMNDPQGLAATLRKGKKFGATALRPHERTAVLAYARETFRAIAAEGISPEDSSLLEDFAETYGQLIQDAKSIPSAEMALMNSMMGTDKLMALFETLSPKQQSVIKEYMQEGLSTKDVDRLMEGLADLEKQHVRRFFTMFDIYVRGNMLSGYKGRIRDITESMFRLTISPMREFFQILGAKTLAAGKSAALMRRVKSGRTFKELKPWATMWLSPGVTEDGRRTITSPVFKRFLESGSQVLELLMLKRNLTEFATEYDETILSKAFVDLAIHDPRLSRRIWARTVTYPYRFVQSIDLMLKAQARPVYQEAFATRVEQWKRDGIFDEQIERFVETKARGLRLGKREKETFLAQAKIDPSILVDNAAKMFAEHNAFQQDPGRLARAIAGINPGVRWIFAPFVTAPVNIVKLGAELTPGVGLVIGDKRQFAEKIGDQLTGLAIIGLLELAKESGWITGAEPDDEEQAKLLRDKGWKPWAFKYTLGDQVYYWQMPIFLRMPFGTYELLANTIKDDATHPVDRTYAMLKASRFMLETVKDSTFLRGLGDFYEVLFPSHNMSDEAVSSRIVNAFGRQLSNLFPYSSFWRSMHSAIDKTGSYDTWLRPEDFEGDTLMQQLHQPFIKTFGYGIPGLINEIPPRMDIFGEPITNKQLLERVPQAWLPVPILGGSNEEVPLDAVEKELMLVGYVPEPPRRNRSVVGRDVTLTDDEYRQYALSYGIRFKDKMRESMRMGLWESFSKEKKQEKISRYAEDARAAAWRETLREIPAIKERARAVPRGERVGSTLPIGE